MNSKFKNMMKKSLIVLFTAALFTGMGMEAEAAKQVPKKLVDARYNDARNRTADFSMAQGYQKGASVWYGGEVVSEPTLNVTGNFTNLSTKNDTELYRNAIDSRMVNNVKLRQNGTVYMMPVKVNALTQDAVNRMLISDQKLNNEFLKLVNKERKAKGLKNLKYAAKLQSVSNTRSVELAKYGNIIVDGVAHRRPNGNSYITAFDNVKSSVIGENVALYSYDGNPYKLLSEKYIAEKLFDQWRNSPSHYQNMIDKRYNYTAVSAKVGEVFPDRNYLNGVYGTQTFCK